MNWDDVIEIILVASEKQTVSNKSKHVHENRKVETNAQ